VAQRLHIDLLYSEGEVITFLRISGNSFPYDTISHSEDFEIQQHCCENHRFCTVNSYLVELHLDKSNKLTLANLACVRTSFFFRYRNSEMFDVISSVCSKKVRLTDESLEGLYNTYLKTFQI
jgi:hypothetical protein